MRRVLIISTTFFPDPGVSAIRMTQWCRHFPKQGWQAHVLCRHYGFEAAPEDLARDVHPDVRVEYLGRSGHPDTAGIVLLMHRLIRRMVNSWFFTGVFVPDVSIRFWRKTRRQILERVRAIQPDVVITTSPPHSNHDIGMWLARETGIPWVADFRDPYLIDNRFKPTGLGRLRWRTHEYFQESVYRRAWLITHAIPIHARWARRRFPFARDRIRILTNGFPLELLDELIASDRASSPRRTVLVAGTIPEPEQLQLARAVAELARQRQDVELRLVGKIPDQKKKLEQILGDRFVATGYLPHHQSIREIADASVLVSYLDAVRSESCLLSMKLFEYLATDKPILIINPSRSECLLLRRISGVRVLWNPSINNLAEAVNEVLVHPTNRDPTEIERFRDEFSWAGRARELAEWLNGLVSFAPQEVSSPGGSPIASVVVPTRNRKELLKQTIRSALAQSVPLELIVLDDGSTDGTLEMIRHEFPEVRLCEFGRGRGPSFLRNRGIELASTELVFPIDDDSVFSSPYVVEQTMNEFSNPRVAAVAIPFINPRLDWTRRQFAPDARGPWVAHAFVGAAHAVRRSLFLKMSGYREHFFYMGEEGDLCIRFLAAGFVVRLGMADPIYHMESARRDVSLAEFYGRRNDVLFAWHNVPMPWLPIHLIATTFNGLVFGFRSRHLFAMLKGIVAGYSECLRGQQREPVSPNLYRLHRRLKKRGPERLEVIESELPLLPRDRSRAIASASGATHASAN